MAEFSFAPAAGIDNVSSPYALGPGAAAEADEVDIHPDGSIAGRRGKRLLLAGGDLHSLWAGPEFCLLARGRTLLRLGADFTAEAVGDFATAGPVRYAVAGSEIYMVNGDGLYRLAGGELERVEAEAGPEVGHILPGELDVSQRSAPPFGQEIAWHGGRLLVAQGPFLFYSEPYRYGLWDAMRQFVPFSSHITGLISLRGGLVVGTAQGVYFLAGPDVAASSLMPLSANPMLAGSAARIEGNLAGDGQMPEPTGLYASPAGFMLVSADGMPQPATAGRYALPAEASGHAALLSDRHGQRYFFSHCER